MLLWCAGGRTFPEKSIEPVVKIMAACRLMCWAFLDESAQWPPRGCPVEYQCFFLLLQIRTIAIIAEGIPEALTRKLIKTADKKGVTIIGPATVSTHGHLLSFLTFRSAFSDGWSASTLSLVTGSACKSLISKSLPSSLLYTNTGKAALPKYSSVLWFLKGFTPFCYSFTGWWDQARLL